MFYLALLSLQHCRAQFPLKNSLAFLSQAVPTWMYCEGGPANLCWLQPFTGIQHEHTAGQSCSRGWEQESATTLRSKLTNSVFALNCYVVIHISVYTGSASSQISKYDRMGFSVLHFCCLPLGVSSQLPFQQAGVCEIRNGAAAVLGLCYQAKNNISTVWWCQDCSQL